MSKAGSLCLWRTENLINISYENTKFGFMAFLKYLLEWYSTMSHSIYKD